MCHVSGCSVRALHKAKDFQGVVKRREGRGVPCQVGGVPVKVTFSSVETDGWNKKAILSAHLTSAFDCWSFSPPPVGSVLWHCSSERSKTEKQLQNVERCRVVLIAFVLPPLLRWLFNGISRYKATELLMLPDNHNGSFLIRESETHQGQRAIFVSS